MVKHEINKLPGSELEIKVTISWSEWEKYILESEKELSKDIKIPGFRPGHAPKNMIEQKIGKDKILEEAAEKAIQKTYAEIIKEEKIEALGSPQAEIMKIAEGNDLEYKIKTATYPEVKINEWKGEIKKMNKKSAEEKIEVTDEEIDKELKKLSQSRAKLITVNREAQKDDSVLVDFHVLRSGVPIEGGSSQNHPMVLGSGAFIPGFEDNLVGMKEREEKEFNLNFPADYHAKHLAGKEANFKVKMNLVQERQIPEINDEFAKSLGKFETLEALKKNFSDNLLEEKKNKKKEDHRAALIDKLVELSEADLPEILVRNELHKMLHEFEDQVQMLGMNADEYLSRIKKTREDLEREWEPQAEKRVKAALILEELAKEQEIKIPNEKIEEEINKTLQYYKKEKEAKENIDMTRLYNYVKGILINEEVFKWLESL